MTEEQRKGILSPEQIESIWNKADCSRGDEAYLREDIFELIISHNEQQQEIESLRNELSALRTAWKATYQGGKQDG